VHAYALRRADGRVAVMLVNTDAAAAHSVRLDLRRGGSAVTAGGLDVFQLSSAQYVWHPHGSRGFARPDSPPATTQVGPDDAVTLPPFSLTVVRTRRTF
jgi:hypothetical protein